MSSRFFFAELTNRIFLEAEEGNISSPCHTVTFQMETVRMLRKVMMTLTKSRTSLYYISLPLVFGNIDN